MIREFRREKGSKIWHYNEKCPSWPQFNYDIWIGEIPPNCEQLCNECYMIDKKIIKGEEK